MLRFNLLMQFLLLRLFKQGVYGFLQNKVRYNIINIFNKHFTANLSLKGCFWLKGKHQ